MEPLDISKIAVTAGEAPDITPAIASQKKYTSLAEIESDLATLEDKRSNLQSRPFIIKGASYMASCAIGIAVAAAAAYMLTNIVAQAGDSRSNGQFVSPPHALLIGSMIVGGIIGICWYAVRQYEQLTSTKSAINILGVKRRTMFPPAAEPHLGMGEATAPPAAQGYFDRLVDIGVKNLSDYYGLVSVHNDKSFSVALITGIVGFLLIWMAIALSILQNNNTLAPGISSASGIITEFIAAVFFYLYSRSVREMRDYFDSLVLMQNTLLSLRLVTEVKDETEKTKIAVFIVGALLETRSPRSTRPDLDENQGVSRMAGQPIPDHEHTNNLRASA